MNPSKDFLSRKEGSIWRCGIHEWYDSRPCPRCRFKGGLGEAKITKCLYDCIRGGFSVHGDELAHVGTVVWIGYLADRGFTKEGVPIDMVGAQVKCPLSNVLDHDKIIVALEVTDVTPEEYEKVFGRRRQ